MVNLKIEDELNELKVFLNDTTRKAVVKAMRSGLSKAGTNTRKVLNQQLRTKIALTASELNDGPERAPKLNDTTQDPQPPKTNKAKVQGWLRIKKAFRGATIASVNVKVMCRHKSIQFRRLMRGGFSASQKGIRPKDRPTMRVEVERGNVKNDRRWFLARARNGKMLVFARAARKAGAITKRLAKAGRSIANAKDKETLHSQAAVSPDVVLTRNPHMATAAVNSGWESYMKEFGRALQHFIKKGG